MSNEEIQLSGFRAPSLCGIDSMPWRVDGLCIVPLPTPGHTAGCICYLIGANLFSGDVLFAEGCGLCRDAAGAYEMFESLQYLKRVLVPHTRIFPGHSYGKQPGQLFADVVRDNIYMQICDKKLFAAFRLRRAQRIPNLFGQ
jgi:hydroxyacylglutathione hydrolase